MARGPAYPYISLPNAVNYARKVYEFAKRSPALTNAVAKDKWGFSPTSSSSIKVLAALRYFGLVVLAGQGETETVKISERAYRILIDSESSPERQRALQEACLSPRAYKLCWDTWGADMPEAMRSNLIFEHGFIDSTVDAFLKNYRASLQFAGLLDGSAKEAGVDDEDAAENGAAAVARVESAEGDAPPVTQVALPKKHISVPVSIMPVPAPPSKGVGMRQEVFALTEGDVVIQWPEKLSPDSWQDFEDWLKILQRKIKRSVDAQSTDGQETEGQ